MEDIKLSDIIDLKFLQEFQNSFAKSINIASVIVDKFEIITEPSNFTELCNKYSGCHPLCNKECNECYIKYGDLAAETKTPHIYQCNSGLTYFAVPIMLNDAHIGSIICGQVLTEEPDVNKLKQVAKELNVDEAEYFEALSKIQIMTFEQINDTANLLFIFANSISQIANKNYELHKKVKQETLLRNVSEKIRSSLDIYEIFEIITNELLSMFDMDRIAIVEYTNKDNYGEYLIKKEYKKREDIISPHSLDSSKQITKYAVENFFINKKPLVFNNILKSDYPEFFKEFYKTLGTNSLLWVPIISENKLWGSIAIAKNDGNYYWSDEDAKFMIDLANQTSIAINQAELYEEAQKNAENESILRRIMLSSSSTFSFEQTINLLVTEAGKLFNADRCFFIEVDSLTQINLPIQEYAEYRSSPDIRPHLEVVPKKSETKTFVNKTLTHKNIYVENINDINLPEATRQMLVEKLSVKSYMIMTVKYGETVHGALVFHYVNQYKKFSEKEISLAEAMASQSANIINQVKLYSKVKQQSEKEFLLRQITQDIGSSLNADDIFSYVCKGLAEIFNIQRVTIIQYPDPKDYSNYKTLKEYKLDAKITGSSDFGKRPSDYPFYQKFGEAWIEFLETQKDYVAINNIQESDMPDFLKESYDAFGQKALMLANISKGKEKWGIIILSEYNCPRNWTDGDVNLMEMISDQLYIAIKQSELYSQMQQQAEREKAILSNLPFMVWLKDIESKFLAVNEPFAKVCGQTPEVLVGKSDYDIWPKELADKYVQDDLEVMEAKKTRAVEEMIQSKDGARWHETQKTPLLNEKGEIVGTTGFSRDITERKEIDKMKSEFVSTVSHELRTPLTSLSGALELVLSGKMGDFSDKIKSLLNMAHNNCYRLTNLINDILDIEKIEAGKMDFEIKTLELMPLIENSIQLNLQYAQKFNTVIKLIEVLPNVFVNADANRLIQVVTNLLSNAIKFSEPDSAVELSVIRFNNNIRVSITNYGMEIPKEFKSRIFQKFAQADSSDSRQKGGTGLGLSIAKLIIENMNGNINFISENNKTIFYFDLPEFINKQREDLNEKTCFNM